MGSHAATIQHDVLDLPRQRDSINASIEEKMRSNNMELPQLVIASVDSISSLSDDLQGFIHPRWWRISSINTTTWKGSREALAATPILSWFIMAPYYISHLVGVAIAIYFYYAVKFWKFVQHQEVSIPVRVFHQLLCFAFLFGA